MPDPAQVKKLLAHLDRAIEDLRAVRVALEQEKARARQTKGADDA